MRKLFSIIAVLFYINSFSQQNFEISCSSKLEDHIPDGRLLLLLSNNDKAEPRFQISDGPSTQLVFGMDVDNAAKGSQIFTQNNPAIFGYPIQDLKDVPNGEYYVQALLHRYETFHRKDGHVVKLPMDRGEGQQWNLAPGNFYSKPVKIKIDHSKAGVIKIEMTEAIPPSKNRKTRNTSSISKFKVNFSASSGEGRCILALIFYCPKDGTHTRM